MGPTTADLKSVVEAMIASLKSAKDPMQTLGTVRADAKLPGQQYQESRVRTLTLVADDPIPSGGTDKVPRRWTSSFPPSVFARMSRSPGTLRCKACKWSPWRPRCAGIGTERDSLR